MPGISGFVSRDPITNPEERLAFYDRVHALDGVTYVKHQSVDSHAVIHCLRTGFLDDLLPAAQIEPDSDCRVFLEGEIYDAGGITVATGRLVNTASPCWLAHAFRQLDKRLADTLNGEFNIVVFDRRDRRLLIFADHLSTMPMYYREMSAGLHFGSEKKSLLAASSDPVEIDPVGLLQIFHHRHYVGERTYIKDVRRLPPGGVLEYRDGVLRLDRRPSLRFDAGARSASPSELIDVWASLLKTATRRRLDGGRRPLISLSAGLDSRTIALSIDPALRPLWARTRGVEGSDELTLGRRIAAKLGFEHMTENPYTHNPAKAPDAIVWRTEGEVTIFNGPTLLNHPAMKTHGDFLAGGYLGDISSGSHIDPRMLVPASPDRFAERMYAWYVSSPRERLRNVFTDDFLDRYLPLVRDDFVASYGPLHQERNVDTHQVWDFYHRQTRMTMAAAPVDSHVFQRVSPFFDREVLDFVTRLPLRLRIGQVLYKAMIHAIGPVIRDIPNSNTLHGPKATVLANQLDYVANLAHRSWKKSRLPQFRSDARIPHARPSETKADMLREYPGSRARLESFIDGAHCDPAIFDKARLRSLLVKHYEGREDYGSMVGLVLTFAAALPMFVYQRTLTCPEVAQPGAAARRALTE